MCNFDFEDLSGAESLSDRDRHLLEKQCKEAATFYTTLRRNHFPHYRMSDSDQKPDIWFRAALICRQEAVTVKDAIKLVMKLAVDPNSGCKVFQGGSGFRFPLKPVLQAISRALTEDGKRQIITTEIRIERLTAQLQLDDATFNHFSKIFFPEDVLTKTNLTDISPIYRYFKALKLNMPHIADRFEPKVLEELKLMPEWDVALKQAGLA